MANFERTGPANPDDDPEVVFLIVCGGGPAVYTMDRIASEQADGRTVVVIATPQAAEWLDADAIESVTGHRLESAMLTPESSWVTPPGHRVLASPVTLNTLTKWADGHADNLAIGLLCEAMGADIPITAELSLSREFANHPAVPRAVRTLSRAGVAITAHPRASRQIDWQTLIEE